MTTLHAVNEAAPPADFRTRATKALETHQGLDLVSFLAMIHDQELAEVVEQAMQARNAVVQTAAAATVDQQMLTSIMSTVVPMLRTSGENAARASHFSTVVETVRTLCREADAAGTTLDTEAVRAALNAGPPPAPFRPQIVGFVASSHYTVGHFRHVTTNVDWHLPFAGYQMCEESPERPSTAHVAFLHKGVVRPRPQLYTEHGLVLEHME